MFYMVVTGSLPDVSCRQNLVFARSIIEAWKVSFPFASLLSCCEPGAEEVGELDIWSAVKPFAFEAASESVPSSIKSSSRSLPLRAECSGSSLVSSGRVVEA